MTQRIFLHVGSPKTGTTFLQQVLWSQRGRAQAQGLLLPLKSFNDHYLATRDVRHDADDPEIPKRAVGIWDKFVAESLAWEGTVLISHELFAGASAEHARAAIERFGQDAEVHVVLTARDLARQIPAEWQEHVKHRSTETYDAFLARLREEDPRQWFWLVQDCAGVLERWGASLPRDRVHVVTVPPAGSDPSVLWTRFAGLLGLDPDSFDLEGSRSNTSLGFEQAELLRQLNERLGDRIPFPGPYSPDVKELFAQTVLARHPGLKIELTGDAFRFAADRSRRMAEEIKALDVDVVGDLAELVPDGHPSADDDGSAPVIAQARLLEESMEAIIGVLEEYKLKRRENADMRRELVELRNRLRATDREFAQNAADRAKGGIIDEYEQLIYDMRYRPIPHLGVGLSQRWPWLMSVRHRYWATAGFLRRTRARLRGLRRRDGA